MFYIYLRDAVSLDVRTSVGRAPDTNLHNRATITIELQSAGNNGFQIIKERVPRRTLTPAAKAIVIAAEAHADGGQVRKYTGEPYIVHPIEVMNILIEHGIHDSEILAAAILHDTVEDTLLTFDMIAIALGCEIADLVRDVTDVSRPEHGNRAVRKQLDLEHRARASPAGKCITMADMISNVRSIAAHDPGFAPKYIREKRAVLEVVAGGHALLAATAERTLAEAEVKISAAAQAVTR